VDWQPVPLQVPLLYKKRRGPSEPLRSAPNFLEDSIPGYTSAGKAEVVFPSFEVTARDLGHLSELGVEIRRLDD
jgi:hypothetical protein